MAKAKIIEDLGGGQYSIQRIWAGRDAINTKFIAYVRAAEELSLKHEAMPQTTDEELFQKNIVLLQIESLLKMAEYLENNMPVDAIVEAWCADYTEGLTGEVGTIDIAGEYTADVNIRPGYVDEDAVAAQITALEAEKLTLRRDISAWAALVKILPESSPAEIAYKLKVYNDLNTAIKRLIHVENELNALKNNLYYYLARDGELYPSIALGPWTSLLNQMIYPGWQKFKPLHRYAWILEDTIDLIADTCAVAIQPTFSLMNYYVNKGATAGNEPPAAEARGVQSNRVKWYNVNYGNLLGIDEITLVKHGSGYDWENYSLETKAAKEFFVKNYAMAHPGFRDFIARNPYHPISQVEQLNPPIYITDEQYIQLQRICKYFDYFFQYGTDPSGYRVGDYWNVMYDIGDPWYWTPAYIGEPQSEMTFGDISLLYDNSGLTIGHPKYSLETYYRYTTAGSGLNWYTTRNLELEFAANQLHMLGPKQKRLGDCISVNEEIYTKEGVKKVGKLKVGDLVLSYDFDKQQYCYKPIVKTWEKGLLPGKRVGLKNGQSIDITDNHPLWTRTNQTGGRAKHKISRYEKVYFKDINLDQWWKRRLPIAVKIPYKIKDIEWLNENLCFVVGHYIAEGWKEPSKVQSSGYELDNHIKPILQKCEIPFSEYKNNSGVPCIRFLKSEFKEFLKTLKENSFDIHLPEPLFHLPSEKLEKILAAAQIFYDFSLCHLL